MCEHLIRESVSTKRNLRVGKAKTKISLETLAPPVPVMQVMVFDVKLKPTRLEEGQSECRRRKRTYARVAHSFCMADVDCTYPLCLQKTEKTALVLMHDEGGTREKWPPTCTQVKKSTLYVSVASTGITIISNMSCSISECADGDYTFNPHMLNVLTCGASIIDKWRARRRHARTSIWPQINTCSPKIRFEITEE